LKIKGFILQYAVDAYISGKKHRTCEVDWGGLRRKKVKQAPSTVLAKEGSHCLPSDRIAMLILFSAPTHFSSNGNIHWGQQCSSIKIS